MALVVTLHDNLTKKQKSILKDRSHFYILKGPAGTSKTYIGCAKALIALSRKEVERIVIIRSAVEIRKMGFLPGTQQEKMDAYAEPYVHLFRELSPKDNFRALVSRKQVEFHSTSYLRGVTFDNSYIVVDEYQNMSEHELETIATRVGSGTRMILCGDSDQSDLPSWEKDGHEKVMDTLQRMPDFSIYEFGTEDIVRSEFVRRYYEAKEGVFTLPENLLRPVAATPSAVVESLAPA